MSGTQLPWGSGSAGAGSLTLPETIAACKEFGFIGRKFGQSKHRRITPDFEIGLAALGLWRQQEVCNDLRAGCAFELTGMATKCVLPMVPALCCHATVLSGNSPEATRLAGSLGLKVRAISNSPSASICLSCAWLCGNCFPSRHKCGCRLSSRSNSGAVARANSAFSQAREESFGP